jgi:uncharacterized coiled-coil protein SlyX
MAERSNATINPRIDTALRDQLVQFCKDQATTQSAVVEEALRRFLNGEVSEDRDRLLMQRLLEFDIRLTKQTEGIDQMAAAITEQQDTLAKTVPMLGAIISILEEQTKEKEVAVVDWDELYRDDPMMQPGPPEGELLADLAPLPTMPVRPIPTLPAKAGWVRRIFGARRTP